MSLTLARQLREFVEQTARRVARAETTRWDWRTVVAVQDAKVSGRGGTCTVEDGLGRQSFGIRWFETRPAVGDIVLVELPPMGGTRHVAHVDREIVASSTTIVTGGGGTALGSVWVPASSMWTTITTGATGPLLVETPTNAVNYWVVDFTDTTALRAEFTLVMPPDYDSGTVTAQFYWTTASTSANSVVWAISAVARNDGQALDVATGTLKSVVDTNGTLANRVRISEVSPPITISGNPLPGSSVQFRVQRLPANASDTLAATVRLLSVMLFYGRA